MSSHLMIRKTHLYGGLLAAVPLSLLCVTGMLLNHADRLGLKPAKYGKPAAGSQTDAQGRAAEFVAGPAVWAAQTESVRGALQEAAKRWGAVPLEHIQIKNERGRGLVVKIKADARLSSGGDRELVWSVAEGRLLEATGRGNWLLDLHTGKLFSARYGFLWSDISAAVLLVLSCTGLLLYLRPIGKRILQRAGLPRKDVAE